MSTEGQCILHSTRSKQISKYICKLEADLADVRRERDRLKLIVECCAAECKLDDSLEVNERVALLRAERDELREVVEKLQNPSWLAAALAAYGMDEPHVDTSPNAGEVSGHYPPIDPELWERHARESHMGDCTNQPAPCVRCAAEMWRHEAEWIISAGEETSGHGQKCEMMRLEAERLADEAGEAGEQAEDSP